MRAGPRAITLLLMTTQQLTAEMVLDAAAVVAESGLAAIYDTHMVLVANEPAAYGLSLDGFKVALWELALAGKLQIAALDMVTPFLGQDRPAIREACAIHKGQSTYRAIRV